MATRKTSFTVALGILAPRLREQLRPLGMKLSSEDRTELAVLQGCSDAVGHLKGNGVITAAEYRRILARVGKRLDAFLAVPR